MDTRFFLKGLDCSFCAEEIRSEVEKHNNVKSANMNFIKKELSVNTNLREEQIFEIVKSIVSAHEPDVIVEPIDDEHDHEHEDKESYKFDIIKLSISALLFLAALSIEFFIGTENQILNITSIILYGISYILCGYEVIISCFKAILRKNFFNENTLMFLASVGAIAIGEYEEAVAVMLLYNIGELLQSIAVNKSRRSITSLINTKPETAELLTENGYETVKPDKVEIGSVIRVKAGEKIPLDGIVINGNSSIDTSALTGESIPRDVTVHDEVKAGTINLSGVIEIKTTGVFADSTIFKMLEMVEQAVEKKTKTENFITVFAKYYTPIVVIIALLIACIPPLFLSFNFIPWIKKGLIFLVISCPCAIVLSVPLGFFAAIGKASSEGILIKGSNYIEGLSKAKTILFDKTGTLTNGNFEVKEIIANSISKEELLEIAAYAESGSNHPIALSILSAYGNEIDESRITKCEEIAGKGIRAVIDNKKIICANRRYLLENDIDCPEYNGFASVYVCVENIYSGCILISDSIKKSSAKSIAELNKNGIKTIILTGDNKFTAETVGKEVGVKEVYSELLPGDKKSITEKEKNSINSKDKVVFVGDGINDAPVIATADIGIAMGAKGADSAIETADIVLMKDDPAQVVFAYELSRKTIKIVKANIIFALVVKFLVQVLGIIGIANMWSAVFADVGVCLIAVANSLRLLSKRNTCYPQDK